MSNCDVFVLDDGFQHLQLARDVDVVIDTGSQWYREGRSALRHADFVIPRRLAIDVEHLRGKRVFAFSALADNEQFHDSLLAAGVELGGAVGFKDHHRYTAADLTLVREEARNVQAD